MTSYGERVIRLFVKAGIQNLYANWGGPHGRISDACALTPNARHFQAMTESSGGFAAIGTSIATRKPGFLTFTQSVGFSAGGLASLSMAKAAGVPLVALVVNNRRDEEGGNWGFQQGINYNRAVRSLAKIIRAEGSSPEQIVKAALQEAYRGTGRPVLVDLYLDEHRQDAGDTDEFQVPEFQKKALLGSDKSKIQKIVESASTKNLFILGRGFLIRTQQNPDLLTEFIQLVEKMGAGVAVDSDAIGAFPANHPHYVGLATRLRTPASQRAIDNQWGNRILLGAAPNAILTDENRDEYYKNHNFVFVHPEKHLHTEMQRIYPKMESIVADVDDVIKALGQQSYTEASIRNQIIAGINRHYVSTPEELVMYEGLDLTKITRAIQKVSDKNTIHIFDGGISANAMAYSLGTQPMSPLSTIAAHRWVGSAHNIAAGIADSGMHDNSTIIAHIGDGAAHYGLSQLAETQLKSPSSNLIVIIYNNSAQMAVSHGWQQRGFQDIELAEEFSRLPDSKFAMMANALGLYGVKVSDKKPDNLSSAIREAQSRRGVTVIDLAMSTPHKINFKGPIITT